MRSAARRVLRALPPTLRDRLDLVRRRRLVGSSPLFDGDWYRAAYPDLSGVDDLLEH